MNKIARSIKSSALLAVSLICLLSLFIIVPSAHAEEAADKLLEIKDKIKTKLQDLTDIRKEEESVISKIESISSDISGKEKELGKYNKRISQSRADIKAISKEIKQINEKLESSEHYMEEHIVALFKRQYNNDAMLLISSDDYNELIRKSRYISLVAYHNNKVLSAYRDELNRVSAKKRRIEGIQSRLYASRAAVSKKKNEYQADLKKKDKLLSEVKARRIAEEKRIKKLEASSRKIAGMVNRLKAKKMPASILGDGFGSKKGQLLWPVEGEVLAKFGKYEDPEFKLEGFRNGIEIKPASGDSAAAIAGGRVVYASSFKDFGNMLIIDHGSGYHSVYARLSEMSLKTGDLVMHGMEVGKIGRSEEYGTPVLYFEIRHKGRPSDPAVWLK